MELNECAQSERHASPGQATPAGTAQSRGPAPHLCAVSQAEESNLMGIGAIALFLGKLRASIQVDSVSKSSTGAPLTRTGADGLRFVGITGVIQKRGSRTSGLGPHSVESDFPHADFGTTSRLVRRKPPLRSNVRLRITSGLPVTRARLRQAPPFF